MVGTKSEQMINSIAGNGLGEQYLGQAIEKGYLIGFRGGRIMSQGKGPLDRSSKSRSQSWPLSVWHTTIKLSFLNMEFPSGGNFRKIQQEEYYLIKG